MKQPASVALAIWMLDHLTPQPHDEALAGDLLEELHGGRSIAWYWRQAVWAVSIAFLERTRNYTLPLAFSTAWPVLYPAWQFGLWRSRFAQSLFDRCSALQWPYSASLELSRAESFPPPPSSGSDFSSTSCSAASGHRPFACSAASRSASTCCSSQSSDSSTDSDIPQPMPIPSAARSPLHRPTA